MRKEALEVALLLILSTECRAAQQCQGKAGFALQACQVASGERISADNTFLSAPLSTGLADTIHSAVLPSSAFSYETADEIEPLSMLDRADDGSFILRLGMFEAYLQSYSLEPNDCAGRVAGFLPALIKGQRAEIIAVLLKQAELHPDIAQDDIQQLLWEIAAGAELKKMTPAARQAAMKILPPELREQLRWPVRAQTAQQKAAAGGIDAGSERGAWAEMPGGFYVRYLPAGCSKIKLQIIMPGPVVPQPGKEPRFDPTQFLAVYSQSPQMRLGITMRPAK
jgi:hypothetical protein